jgi:hypothetical protein
MRDYFNYHTLLVVYDDDSDGYDGDDDDNEYDLNLLLLLFLSEYQEQIDLALLS